MTPEIKELEGLSPENRRRMLADTELKYKTVIKELQETTEYIDELVGKSAGKKNNNFNTLLTTLLQIIHIQSKMLTDIRLELNEISNEHNAELHYIHLNLEIMYKSISDIDHNILELKK